jgi:hypothetical protein
MPIPAPTTTARYERPGIGPFSPAARPGRMGPGPGPGAARQDNGLAGSSPGDRVQALVPGPRPRVRRRRSPRLTSSGLLAAAPVGGQAI